MSKSKAAQTLEALEKNRATNEAGSKFRSSQEATEFFDKMQRMFQDKRPDNWSQETSRKVHDMWYKLADDFDEFYDLMQQGG